MNIPGWHRLTSLRVMAREECVVSDDVHEKDEMYNRRQLEPIHENKDTKDNKTTYICNKDTFVETARVTNSLFSRHCEEST